MQPVLEAGRDAEVAAAAADRPEQVRVDARRRRRTQLAVGGHDLGGEQGVDRQAVLAHEVADAATERDPAEPDRARVAEAGRQAVLGGGRRVLGGGQARPGPGGPCVDVDVELVEVAQVDHDAVVDDAEARRHCARRCGRRAGGRSRARARSRGRRRRHRRRGRWPVAAGRCRPGPRSGPRRSPRRPARSPGP